MTTKQNNSLIPKINVKLAITEEQAIENIKENLKIMPRWFDQYFYPNGFEAIIISAGPSMEKYVEEINLKARMENIHRDFIVFCVKHALPRLLAMGIEPDFCVILDGRPLDEDSTHGVNRKGLFAKIPEKTIFMVASMTHPDYARYLMSQGARVLGWHTQVKGLEKFPIKEPIVNGGTSSGTRCIAIAHGLGIREITLVGFDSCHHDITPEKQKLKDKKGRPKFIPFNADVSNYVFSQEQVDLISKLGDTLEDEELAFKGSIIKRFWTTGELLAQAQDFEQIFKDPSFDFKFQVLDDGIVSHLFKNLPRPIRGNSFVEYFKNTVPKKNLKDIPRRNVVLGRNSLKKT